MFKNKKEFLEEFEKYSDINWNNLKPLSEVKDVYIISGHSVSGEIGTCKIVDPFEIDEEFIFFKDAQKFVNKMKKKWKDILPGSIRIKQVKSEDILWLHILKNIKDKIDKGEAEFPIYLGP